MQKDSPTPVEIVDDDVPEIAEVDAKLVALARARSKAILTNDFNLNRVAELQGVRVLNINSLANAVKPAVLPGEELRVRVIQEGKEAGQGVGFLDDGTMIVVEGGVRYIDKDLDVAVTRVLQTVAGPDDLRPAAARLSRVAARRWPTRSPTRSSSPPGPRGGWTASTSSPTSVAGRPLLAWSIDALARVRRRRADRRRDARRARRRDSRWRRGCRRRSSRVVAGGERRQESVAAGLAALDRARRRTRRDDRVVLVHDGARPLVDAGARRGGRPSGRGARRGDPGRCRSPRRSSGSTATCRRDRRPDRAGRGPDAAGRPASLLRSAFERFPPSGPETWTDEAALLEACRIPVHAIPGEPTQPQGDAARAISPGSEAARPAPATPATPAAIAVGYGSDSHPFGPGAPLMLGGIAIDGRAAPARPLRRRRRAPRGRRRAARRGGPGRPRPAVPGRPGDAARASPARELLATSSRGVAAAGLARRQRRRDDRRRAAAAGRAASTRCGAAHRRAPRRRRERGQRQGLDRQPRPGWRAPAAASRPHAPSSVVDRLAMTIRLHDTLSRRDPAARAARGRSRPDLQLRPDGLRPGPHRQLPELPVRRPPRPLPAVARPARHVGDEHHRRRRQDHPGRGGRGRRRSTSWPTAGSSASSPTRPRSG